VQPNCRKQQEGVNHAGMLMLLTMLMALLASGGSTALEQMITYTGIALSGLGVILLAGQMLRMGWHFKEYAGTEHQHMGGWPMLAAAAAPYFMAGTDSTAELLQYLGMALLSTRLGTAVWNFVCNFICTTSEMWTEHWLGVYELQGSPRYQAAYAWLDTVTPTGTTKTKFLVDLGAATSIIAMSSFTKTCLKYGLQPSLAKLRAASGHSIGVAGEGMLHFKLPGISEEFLHKMQVVQGESIRAQHRSSRRRHAALQTARDK